MLTTIRAPFAIFLKINNVYFVRFFNEIREHYNTSKQSLPYFMSDAFSRSFSVHYSTVYIAVAAIVVVVVVVLFCCCCFVFVVVVVVVDTAFNNSELRDSTPKSGEQVNLVFSLSSNPAFHS